LIKTIEALNEWVYDRESWNTSSNALFISENGNRISATALSELVEKYCQDALGYHISPHKLRAGFCSILYKETGNAEFVRRAVGHSNISTTQRYIVTDNNERAKASELIDGLLH
jgi:site-specific recombinase XerC